MSFFILICGTKYRHHRVKNPRASPPGACPNCRSLKTVNYYREDEWFTFFFIPIIRFSKGFCYLRCEACGRTIQIRSPESMLICQKCSLSIPRENAGRFCPDCGEALLK